MRFYDRGYDRYVPEFIFVPGFSPGRGSMKVFGRQVEPLVIWWALGIAIAYLFLIWLIAWLIFQGVLLVEAYNTGNFSYIDWKLWRYALMAVVYFAIGGFLKAIRFI